MWADGAKIVAADGAGGVGRRYASTMDELFASQVVRLEPARGRAGWVRVVAGGGGVVMSETRCVELGVRPGRVWTAELAAACERGAAVDALKEKARKFLSKARRSREQLRERLMRGGPDAGDVESALDELERAGLVDDAAYARAVVESGTEAGPGRRYLLERKLAVAGVSHELIAQALADACPPPDDDARRLVEAKLAKCPAHEPRVKTAARLARLLATRGFDEHTARDAIEAAMGTIEDGEPND